MRALYRISKYNPIHRINGVYLKNEWTDYSDIGCTFEGVQLSFEQYSITEQRYIDVAIKIARETGVEQFVIVGFEKYEEICQYFDKQIILLDQIEDLLKQCLRNKCWCILLADEYSISFGYDYYMHISTNLSKNRVIDICKEYSLFVDKVESDKTVLDLFGDNITNTGDGSVC